MLMCDIFVCFAAMLWPTICMCMLYYNNSMFYFVMLCYVINELILLVARDCSCHGINHLQLYLCCCLLLFGLLLAPMTDSASGSERGSICFGRRIFPSKNHMSTGKHEAGPPSVEYIIIYYYLIYIYRNFNTVIEM
jgi:hypothetical protein